MASRTEVEQLLPLAEGQLCVVVEGFGEPYLARLEQIQIEATGVLGRFAWADPVPPPEHWDNSFFATWELLLAFPEHWQILYCNCRYVFDPPMVARAAAGDYSWLPGYFDGDPTTDAEDEIDLSPNQDNNSITNS